MVKDVNDINTGDMISEKKKRGPKPSGKAKSGAERQAEFRQRQRIEEEALKAVTVTPLLTIEQAKAIDELIKGAVLGMRSKELNGSRLDADALVRKIAETNQKAALLVDVIGELVKAGLYNRVKWTQAADCAVYKAVKGSGKHDSEDAEPCEA